MICPIVNDNFIKLQSGLGRGLAAEFVSLPDFTPNPKETEIRSTLRDKVQELGVSYFATAYPSLLSPYLSDYTVDEVVDGLYSRLNTVSGDVTKEKVGDTPLLPPVEVAVTFQVAPQLQKTLESLSRNFGFPFTIINQPGLSWKGKYVNVNGERGVVVNVARATPDTPFHEYFHPFVRQLMTSNPELYAKIAKEAPNTSDSTEENVTQYLGVLAARLPQHNLLSRFMSFIKSLLFDTFGIRVGLTPSTKVGQLVRDLVEKGATITDNTLKEAYQAFDLVSNKVGIASSKVTRERTLLSKIRAFGDTLTTNDKSEFYSENGVEKYRRATSFVSSKTSGEFTQTYANGHDSVANYLAHKVFEERGLSKADTIEVSGTKFTFDDFVGYYEIKLEAQVLEGKLKHAYLDHLTNKDKARSEAALRAATDYAKKIGTPYVTLDSHPLLRNLNAEHKVIMSDFAGVRTNGDMYDDLYDSEVTVTSDLLVDKDGNPLATTIDLLVQSYNGDLGVVDFKTGSITYAYDTSALMPYGEALGVRDSKLSRGFLEEAIRIVALKEKNPDARFSYMRIVKIDRWGNHEKHDGDLELYLKVISNYYQAKHPERHKELVSRGLLDINNYRGTSAPFKNYHSLIANMTAREALDWVSSEMTRIEAIPRKGEMPQHNRDELSELAKLRLELEGIKDVEVDLSSGDKNGLSKWMGNLSDINKKSVQGLHKAMIKAREAENKERNQVFTKWDEKLKAYLAEQKDYGKYSSYNKYVYAGLLYGVATVSLPWIVIPLTASYFIKRANGRVRDHYSFMLQKSEDPTKRGYYLNITDKHPVTGRDLTKAEKELRDEYKNTLTTMYSQIMNEIVGTNEYGYNIYRYQMHGEKASPELPEDFFARVPMTLDEAKEESTGMDSFFGIKTSAEHFVKSNIVTLLEREYGGSQKKAAVKLKFMGHPSQIENYNHSFNADLSFKLFAAQLIHKKHFDDLYPFAQGIRNIIEDAKTPDGKQALPNILEMVDSQIAMQILDEPKQSRFLSRDMTIKINPTLSKVLKVPVGSYVMSQDSILRQLKSSLSFVSMGFKFVGGVKNLAIITLTNGLQITKSMVGSIGGLVPDEEAKRSGSAALAFKDYAVYLKDALTDNLENNKLYQLAKHLDWFPDNYDYNAAKSDLLVDTTKPSLGNASFMFHNFTETYGMLLHLSAIARQTTVQTEHGVTTLWDAYEMKDGKIAWTKGSRGYTSTGDKLEELDALEIKSLKRAYERLHGSYRKEERTTMELTVFGQFVSQFRRYFYRYLINNFGSKVDDISIGRYIESKSIKRPDGVPVYEWENEIMQGRLAVLSTAIIAATKGELSAVMSGKEGLARRKRIAELINTAMWFAGALFLYGLADDDEEETKLDRLATGAIYDSAQGLAWKDLSGTAKQPVIFLARAEQIISGVFAQFGSNENRAKRGRSDIRRNVPVLSNADQIRELFNTVDDTSESFGFFK